MVVWLSSLHAGRPLPAGRYAHIHTILSLALDGCTNCIGDSASLRVILDIMVKRNPLLLSSTKPQSPSSQLLTKLTKLSSLVQTIYNSWLRHYATDRKVAGSSPDEVEFFQLT
jgi:hypothetical protein